MGKRINLFGKKKPQEVKENKYPMMEYFAPRRILATPMGKETAERGGIVNAFDIVLNQDEQLPSNNEGFHVKEAMGSVEKEYWIPREIFDQYHVRTNLYTIGEVVLMLSHGILFQREYWPKNKFIQYRDSVALDQELKQMEPTKENPAFAKLEGFVSMVTIHADPIKKDKFDIHIEQWVPTLEDLFAKDFREFKVNLTNLSVNKTRK